MFHFLGFAFCLFVVHVGALFVTSFKGYCQFSWARHVHFVIFTSLLRAANNVQNLYQKLRIPKELRRSGDILD